MNILHLLSEISIAKTIYFNFRYFNVRTALRFPVFVYRRTKINTSKGSVILTSIPRPGMMRLGIKNLGNQDMKYSRTIWDQKGQLVVGGDVFIGRGSKISIGEKGVLTLGHHFTITGHSDIICHNSITFGQDCLLAWDILIMDTDFHKIINKLGVITNPPKPIVIGNHVWIGCRSTILKGTKISDNSIIASNTRISGSYEEGNCIIAGQFKNANIIKRDVNWEP